MGIWEDQASLLWSDSSAHLNHSKGPLFCKPSGRLLVSDKLEGVVTLASERADQAGLARSLDPGVGWRGSVERTTAGFQLRKRRPRHQVPTAAASARPCRQRVTCTSHRSCARRHVLFWGLNTGERACPVLWHGRLPDGLLQGHIFTDGSSCGNDALRRAGWAVVAVDDVGNLKAAAYGAVPSDVLPGADFSRRRGLCRSHGRAHHFGSAHAAHRLRRYHRDSQWPHVWNRASGVPPTRLGAVRVKGHATQRDVEAGRTSHLCKKETTLQTPLPRKEQTHTSLLFGSARQSLLVLSWPSKRRGELRFRSWNDTRVAAARPQGKTTASKTQAHEAGERQAGFWSGVRLAFLPSFPHASRKTVISTLAHSEGTACSWDELSILGVGRWTVPSSSAPHVERCIGNGGGMPCAAAAAGFLGGRISQLRILRSGLFANERYLVWTVEHVRRPILDEATTPVAQLESCECWSGQKCCGAHHTPRSNVRPRRQRCWPTGSALVRLSKMRTMALQRFRPGSAGLLGVARAQRSAGVKSLPSKAGGSRTHKTD